MLLSLHKYWFAIKPTDLITFAQKLSYCKKQRFPQSSLEFFTVSNSFRYDRSKSQLSPSAFVDIKFLLPPANEVWGMVICLQVSICPQGMCPLRGCAWSGAVPAPGGVWFQGAMPAPGGGGWSQGVPTPGGGLVPRESLVPRGSGSWAIWFLGVSGPRGYLVETPPGRLLLQTVHILLECILVDVYKSKQSSIIGNNHHLQSYLINKFHTILICNMA